MAGSYRAAAHSASHTSSQHTIGTSREMRSSTGVLVARLIRKLGRDGIDGTWFGVLVAGICLLGAIVAGASSAGHGSAGDSALWAVVIMVFTGGETIFARSLQLSDR